MFSSNRKRGASQLITTVILLGFTIVIGTVVAVYGVDLINNLTDSISGSEQPVERTSISYVPIESYERTYIYDSSGIVAINKDSNVEYLTKDYLGSTRAITNEQGNVIYEEDYYPYGEQIQEDYTESVTYAGKEYDDEIGLYYYGARYYDPSSGRFTQVDPISSVNSPYESFKSNPMKYIDPDGRDSVETTGYLDDKYVNGWVETRAKLRSGGIRGVMNKVSWFLWQGMTSSSDTSYNAYVEDTLREFYPEMYYQGEGESFYDVVNKMSPTDKKLFMTSFGISAAAYFVTSLFGAKAIASQSKINPFEGIEKEKSYLTDITEVKFGSKSKISLSPSQRRQIRLTLEKQAEAQKSQKEAYRRYLRNKEIWQIYVEEQLRGIRSEGVYDPLPSEINEIDVIPYNDL